MRKTALLTGVAGLFLMSAPAFAQDSTAPQTPPASAETAPVVAEQSQTLTLQPGSDVKGSDGTVLGQLEGARNGDAGQELTVRGSDGALRAVPVSSGVRQDGEGVAVGWTSAQFASAASISDPAADVAEPAAEPMPAQPPESPPEAPPEAPVAPDETPGMVPPTPPTLPPAVEPADPAADEASNPELDAPGR
ncbi:MAG: superoxide dismutase [Brevundimonas sp.]